MLVPPESASAVLAMICSKSVSIYNHSRARLVDSSKNRTFSMGYPNLMRSYGGVLEPRGSSLTPLKSTLEVRNSFMRRRVTVKSNDRRSDLFSGQTSKHHNSIGRHLLFTTNDSTNIRTT